MSAKRRAGSELNADNWDEPEGEGEDNVSSPGTFHMAPERELQTRVIRTARRRTHVGGEEGKRGIFSSFGGFTKTPSSTALSSPFSFLSSMKNGNPGMSNLTTIKEFRAVTENKSDLKNTLLQSTHLPQSVGSTSIGQQAQLKYSDEYCAHLKDLNQSICEWIKQNVEKNPYCILTPIFEDYKKYLKDFDKYKESDKRSDIPSITDSNNENVKKSIEPAVSIKDNIFEGVVTSQSCIFETPKLVDKTERKLTNPPQNSFAQIYSSTPVSKSLPTFSFVQNTPATSTSNFSFASGKPYTFQNKVIPEEAKADIKEDEENEVDDEPPSVTFTPVVEEDSVYSKKCKVFVSAKGQYSDRGIGTLYLKPIPDKVKYQLIVRADTSIGNLLLNMVLSEAIPTRRMGKNNVLLVTIPTPESAPQPVTVLLRVKTSEEADQLLETLEKYKK